LRGVAHDEVESAGRDFAETVIAVRETAMLMVGWVACELEASSSRRL
jgi:hypothetical protein